MTRDEIRQLIGGYATGSLTEAEKKLLFEAALEDQELFDELAGEQALKETFDLPGARERLIAALAPSPRLAWWRRPLIWSAIATAAAGIAVLGWIVEKPKSPVQMARVESAPAAPPQSPPGLTDRPAPPPPPRVAKKAASVRQAQADEVEEKAKIAPAAAPPVAPASPAKSKDAVQVQSANAVSRQALAVPAAIGGVAQRFAFDYSLEDSSLVLKFASDGYISIHFSPGLDTIVDARVAAGSQRRESIPNNATEAAIVFSAEPQSTSGGVSLTRGDKSGTVSDPARMRIELLLKFYP